jgi:hypothetical protein
MRIRMLRGTVGPDGSGLAVGAEVDVPEALGIAWCRNGRATPLDAVTLDPGILTTFGDPSPSVQSSPAEKGKRR